MDFMQELLPHVQAYLKRQDWRDIPVMNGRVFEVTPLAQGEYNLNYLLSTGDLRLVLRVNIGSQIGREDQIVYEFRALKQLQQSGITPRSYFMDDTRRLLDRGLLVMDFLPGEPLDYRRDAHAAPVVRR